MATRTSVAPAQHALSPASAPAAAWRRALATLGLLAALTAAHAADALPGKLPPGDPRAKIGSALRASLDAVTKEAATGPGLGARLRAVSPPSGSDDTVIVRLDTPAGAADLAAIRATGATVLTVAARWKSVTVEATAAQIEALARLPAVGSVSLPRRPIHRAQPGTVVNQAGAVIRSDQLTAATGVTGAGQVVGIISDSFNLTSTVGSGTTSGSAAPFTLTGTQPQNSGDLPASIQVVDFGATANTHPTDEGEAMMEECYKLAPGAGYAFASAGAQQSDMAVNIASLGSQTHCTVICDDIAFPDEPMFQDGPIAQAATTFVQGGGIYLSAFGNDADQAILTTYADVSAAADPNTDFPTGADYHNWGIGGATPGFLPLDIPVSANGSTTITITLQWNQPYQSFGLGAGSQSDYDLFLFANPVSTQANLVTPTGPTISVSVDQQGTPGHPAGDPVEVVQHKFANTGTTAVTRRVYLAVDRFAGAPGALLRIVINCTRAFTSPNYATVFGANSGFGHPVAPGVLAIAAVDVTSPAPFTPESFTSKGGLGSAGVPYFFDTTGAALSGAPQHRDKPDLTAPDGIAVFNSDFNHPFFGTSAAVPNAAAAAALVWAANPALTNQQVIARLVGTAVDVTGAPATSGVDAFTGHGMIDALAAASIPVTGIDTTAADGLHETGSVPIQVTFANPVVVTGTPTLLLNTAPPRSATFTSGSGGATLTFTYAIAPGDLSAHLDAASASALGLSGATITGTGGLPINTVLPAPGAAGSLGANSAIDVDATGPGTTIVGSPASENDPHLTFIVTFSQPVTGINAGRFSATNGTISPVTGSGAVYIVHVTATAPGAVALSIAAGAVLDAAGLGNHAASGTATFDTTPPTLVITPSLGTVVASAIVPVTFTFSEAVTGFAAGDVTVTNGTVGALSGSGASYTMPITAGTAGTMTITVLAGAVTDLATNASSTDASATVTVTTAPASSSSGHKCGLGSLFASVLGLGLLALMARVRGRDGADRR